MSTKCFARVALVACLTLGAALATAQERKYLLFYGNSFTNAGVPTMVRNIASAAGHPTPIAVNASVDGQTLQWHLNSPSQLQRITTGIPSTEKWDNVILQDFSTWPTHIGNLSQHVSSSLAMYQAVAAHSPDVVPVMYETWARGYGDAFYAGGSPAFPGGSAQMQQELRDGYRAATANINANVGAPLAKLAPAGDAWELANFPANFYGGDITYHSSNRGTLLNSLILYGTIYDDPTTSDINLSSELTRLGLSAADGVYLTSLADRVLTTVPEPGALVLGGITSIVAVLATQRQRRVSQSA